MDAQTKDDYADLARKLCAAYISYNLGLKSVDHTLKQHVPESEPVGNYWYVLAERVAHEAVAARFGKPL